MDQTHNRENVVVTPLSTLLSDNINTLQGLMSSCNDYIERCFTIGGTYKTDVYLAYIDNMVDREPLEQNIIRNLMHKMDDLPAPVPDQPDIVFAYVRDKALQSADIKELHTMDEITQAIMFGDVILFVEGFRKALLVSFKDFPSRGVPQVETEVTVRGAKDSFTESSAINKVLIRRRIKDTHLKFESVPVGARSRTDVSIAYVDGIARPELIEQVKADLNSFTIDGIFDVGMLEQLLEQSWNSPFPQLQSTERPDKASSSLLEGRIALLVDNSPMVLLMPASLSCFFQASDDYYSRWQLVSLIRILRYIGALLAIGLPGLYIAITNYQPEMIPTPLMLSFAAARQGVPFSILVEVIIMMLAFELLTEAGIRPPSPMGNTIGVVGGLIIGDAAISANLVSPMVVIVVAFTAITSFAIPNETFSSAFRITRYLIIFLSSMLGLFGFITGMMLVLLHLSSLRSYGTPYLSPFVAAPTEKQRPWQDSLLRYPISRLRRRPLWSQDDEKIRFTKKNKQ